LGQQQLQQLLPLLDKHSEERPQLQQRAAPSVSCDPSAQQDVAGLADARQAVLDRFAHDITGQARAGGVDPVYGRDNEIRQVIDVLSRRRKNNPILVGDPGVGKTALVEGLALCIAQGNVPDSLKNVTVRTFDYRNAITLGMAPGGIVKIWVRGACLGFTEVGRFQAKIEPLGPYRNGNHRYYRAPNPKAQAYIDQHGISYGSW
jgi:hypothetical protein